MKKLSLFLFCMLTAASALVIAKEPANLAIAKQGLKHYHDSGAYLDDFADTAQKAMRYLQLRVSRNDFNGKKPAIILDIDETSLSNYPNILRMDFGGTLDDYRENEAKAIDQAFAPTLKLYRYAKAHNIAVFFISGRFERERQPTEENLKKAGFVNHDGLILRNADYETAPAATFKTVYRKALTEKGYDIIANIGDQKSDLRGGYADETFKLPNPYYYIP
jgi:predicted secreted acid phosphatase